MLEIHGLTVEYPTSKGIVHAVNDVSFSVPANTMVGLVGETGSGKSATVRSLVGLLRPPGRVVAGSALLDGQDLIGMPHRDLRRQRGQAIGYVGQNPFGSLNPVLRIDRQFENVVSAHRPTKRAQVHELARLRLLEVGIREPDRVLDGYAHELSGGMAQRVVIAIATLLNPQLIIADEPTTALDVTVQRQIMDLLRGLVKAEHRSVLLVTHDLGVVAQYCDHVAVMFAGQIVEVGPVRGVLREPSHHYTRALIDAVPRGSQPPVAPNPSRGALDLINYPSGCPYQVRCGAVSPICEEQRPAAAPAAEGGSVYCHNPVAPMIETDKEPAVIEHGAADR